MNGERSWKGKEYGFFNYYFTKAIFEGEYLKGKSNGKGKEYDNNDKIIFEG